MREGDPSNSSGVAGECFAPDGGGGIDRRDFFKALSVGTAAVTALDPRTTTAEPDLHYPLTEIELRALRDAEWPVLRYYDQNHLARIALPLGGIGTGTVSLGGRGNLRDWEIMNRPAKGFVPASGDIHPFFALFTRSGEAKAACRILEGPLELAEYEGSHGSTSPNHNMPRFRHCSFAAAYPLGRVILSDPEIPLEVHLKAFNPLIPADPDASGIPVAVLTYELHNRTSNPMTASVCGSLPNFIGIDGGQTQPDWKGDRVCVGASANHNEYRESINARGVFMSSQGVPEKAANWGTIALATLASEELSSRTSWAKSDWGNSLLDFWDDFSADGRLDQREAWKTDTPLAS